MNNQPSRKTLMLGLDAGDLTFIQNHLDTLPHLGRLFESGQLFSLKTTSELLTGSVWPTFYTGTLPGEHGIYHHLQWDPDGMRVKRVAEDWLYCEPFWYELARQGVKVCVADVPMIFPSRLPTGTEVVNWGSHDQLGPFHCNRADITDFINRQWGSHPMGPEIPVGKNRTQLDRIRRNLVDGAEKKGRLLQALLERTDWEFFLAVFGESHRGGHILWPEPDSVSSAVPEHALLDVYRAIDRALGGILNRVDAQTTDLIVFSLHGMQENQSQEHFVAPVMERINAVFYRGEADNGNEEPAKQRSVMRWLRSHVPAALQHAIAEAMPVEVRDWVVSRATDGGYDWRHTPAFPLLADYNGYLRFNIEGRERLGCLTVDSPLFQRYGQFVADCFLELRQLDNGLPLVKEVVPVQKAFPGSRCHLLPDIAVTWQDSAPASRIGSARLDNFSAQLETGRSGNHRAQGFALFSGVDLESFAPGMPPLSHIADLAPWLLKRYRR